MQVQSLGREDPLEKGQPTPVLLPGESSEQRSLAGYRPRVGKSWTRLSQLSTHTHTGTQARGSVDGAVFRCI